MAYLVLFSEPRIALNREVANHPELMELLQKHPANEFEIRLAEIASYCEVILDGVYSQMELDKLCDILYKKLIQKRTPIWITSQMPAPTKH